MESREELEKKSTIRLLGMLSRAREMSFRKRGYEDYGGTWQGLQDHLILLKEVLGTREHVFHKPKKG